MRAFFQSIIKRFKRTRLYYEIQRSRQIKSLKQNLDHPNPEYRKILQTVDKDGICIVENFMPKEECDRLIKDLDVAFNQIKEGTFDGMHQYNHEKLIRIGDLNDYVESTNIFFHNPMFDEIAKAYVDPKAYSYRREAELRDNVNEFQQADIPHIDDWRLRFKFFLYLTDVGPENAPFVYYKGTHKDEPWKYRKNFEYERDGQDGAYGHYHPQEMRALSKKIKLEPTVCTGKAGTLIIGDFRGIHNGSPLKAGRRILLNSTYGI
ncbi:MAG: hypothetical protein EP338_08645 [Bacteroidetes bacterium]|nr:MAG: hypothetical protein EP338_08645 [Bacteroidota bacterium]